MKSRDLIRRCLSASVLGLAGIALSAGSLATLARADDAASPARAVRLSSVEGQVQVFQGKELLANSAVQNTPLFEGSLVTTGDDGRAEIQFEDGTVARLSPNSSLALAKLRGQGNSGEAELALESGLAYFELQGAGLTGTISVRFGDSVVTASGYTVIRVNLDSTPGEVAVFAGNAHLERSNALSLDLHGGESVALSSADASRYSLSESIESDSWDTWNSDRDEALSAAGAARTGATSSFPDAGNPAWSDLDSNGNWYNVPDQGYIWSPNEAANQGFDPYGNGYWMWTPGFGYIWVSGYSWGYTPFQCGTWNYYDAFGWGWAPGIGGCQPWWGGRVWAPNLGRFPVGYRGPLRPTRPLPRRPPNGGGPRQPIPMVVVNRHTTGGSGLFPARDRSTVVSIAGYTVQALHPVSPRPQYDHSGPGYVSHTIIPGGTSVHGAGPVSGSMGAIHSGGTLSPARPSGGYSAPRPPSGASPVNRAPSGGGGGGGGHASSGGGHK